jgi:HEAT repeat protein
MLPDRQPDLFDGGGAQPPAVTAAVQIQPRVAEQELDDAALIAAIPEAGVQEYRELIGEATKRRLSDSVPALEAFCRRFKGFGLVMPVPEQSAAVQALAAIGGLLAAEAVARIIADGVVQKPGIAAALRAAARLGCRLPDPVVIDLLKHPEPGVRADAARCTHRPRPATVAVLIDLLDDLNHQVAAAAACALGRQGRSEARPMLLRLLADQPSAEVIQAIANVADEACIVLLGRIARAGREYADDALEALRDMDNDRAAAIVAAIDRTEGRSL